MILPEPEATPHPVVIDETVPAALTEQLHTAEANAAESESVTVVLPTEAGPRLLTFKVYTTVCPCRATVGVTDLTMDKSTGKLRDRSVIMKPVVPIKAVAVPDNELIPYVRPVAPVLTIRQGFGDAAQPVPPRGASAIPLGAPPKPMSPKLVTATLLPVGTAAKEAAEAEYRL